FFVFFFQAEDGIRDRNVTGVQTCALPIYNCGNQLDPIDLINPVSKINGETPEFVETEHFLLDLPALADVLTEWLHTREDWRPNTLKFSLNLIKDMRPRAITRTICLGIPIPIDGWVVSDLIKMYVSFEFVIVCRIYGIDMTILSGNPYGLNVSCEKLETRHCYCLCNYNITFPSLACLV